MEVAIVLGARNFEAHEADVLSGVNGLTGEKVLQYTTVHIDPRTFGTLCVAMCRLFLDEQGEGAWFAFDIQTA